MSYWSFNLWKIKQFISIWYVEPLAWWLHLWLVESSASSFRGCGKTVYPYSLQIVAEPDWNLSWYSLKTVPFLLDGLSGTIALEFVRNCWWIRWWHSFLADPRYWNNWMCYFLWRNGCSVLCSLTCRCQRCLRRIDDGIHCKPLLLHDHVVCIQISNQSTKKRRHIIRPNIPTNSLSRLIPNVNGG